MGPPEDELGVAVPLSLVVGRSDNGVVALRQATVYSEGVTLDFIGLARGLGRRESNRLIHAQHRFDEEEPSENILRIGLELPDGRRVSNLGVRRDHGSWAGLEEQPTLVFFEHGGGGSTGGGGRVSTRPSYWLWPVPGSGQIQVFCEWPVVEIPLASASPDVAPLVEPRKRVVPLWPSA
jgi:hypothetical protein